jgi:hypothetical protein
MPPKMVDRKIISEYNTPVKKGKYAPLLQRSTKREESE